MNRPYSYIVLLLFTVSFTACREPKEEKIARLVTEWSEKEIQFPIHSVFTRFGKDTINSFDGKGKYRIVTYVDSIGCMSCKLKLFKWKELIRITDSLTEYSTPYLFYFHPKDLKELRYILKRDAFDYPVCIDLQDEFNKLNRFPSDYTFQTFLLDAQNKVVAMGNPIHNPKVKELYLAILTGKKRDDKASLANTNIAIDKMEADFGEFKGAKTQSATFNVKNIGEKPFVMQDVITSCDCVKVKYSKESVKPGGTLTLEVNYSTEYIGDIYETINLYCNIKNSPIELQVKGIAR